MEDSILRWFSARVGLMLLATALLVLLVQSCRTGNSTPRTLHVGGATQNTCCAACLCPNQVTQVGLWTSWPSAPQSTASSAFWKVWGDGKAEMNSYRAKVPRYGEIRDAELVLIYVTEPMHRKTWIKDDNAEESNRISVLKLNISQKFVTGLYPYSVMTSVFSPVDHWRKERFSPAKLTLSVQEWCGHVYGSVWPAQDRYLHQGNSYFASEGEFREDIKVSGSHLYEDALLIQLRELEGPLVQGKPWTGWVIPSLWRNRKEHQPLRPQRATLTRQRLEKSGQVLNQFVLTFTENGFTRTYEVETTGSRRMMGWRSSDGEHVVLHKSLRMPYWNLNSNHSRPYRKKLGLNMPTF